MSGKPIQDCIQCEGLGRFEVETDSGISQRACMACGGKGIIHEGNPYQAPNDMPWWSPTRRSVETPDTDTKTEETK